MRSIHVKYDHPGLEPEEVCIGYIQGSSVEPLGWRTKRPGQQKMLTPWMTEGGPEATLSTAIIVKRSELIERGYEETKTNFIKSE